MPAKTATYAALLLGINIGPHKRVPMAELKKMCERLGHVNVRTLLASGNVILEARNTDAGTLAREMEAQLKKTFGFEVGVIALTGNDLLKMLEEDPFRKIPATQNTRLYATLLAEAPRAKIALPPKHTAPDGGSFEILRVSDQAAYSVVVLGETGTTEAMEVLKKLFGKKITTRNWNTIRKIAEKISGK